MFTRIPVCRQEHARHAARRMAEAPDTQGGYGGEREVCKPGILGHGPGALMGLWGTIGSHLRVRKELNGH